MIASTQPAIQSQPVILRMCIILAVLKSVLAAMLGPILYIMNHEGSLLYPALAESVLFLGVPLLARLGKPNTAILFTFLLECMSTLYFGLQLGPNAPVWVMGIFLAGIAMLFFQDKPLHVPAVIFAILIILTIELNNKIQVVTSVRFSEDHQLLLKEMVITMVLFLNCLMLYFYIRQIRVSHEKVKKVAELEAARQALRVYVRDTNHELRSPLHVIYGICQRYLAFAKGPRHHTIVETEHLEYIQLACTSMLDLINNDLEWARLEAGESDQPVLASMQLTEWLRKYHLLYQQMAQDKSVTLNMHLATNMPATILSDQAKLTRILRNLLTNAIKFSPAGESVTMDTYFKDNQLIIAIKDNGRGMTPAQQQQVFEPFYSQREESMEGTGLGLPIVRKSINDLGGTIHLSSELGKGSTFTIKVPVQVMESLPAAGHLSGNGQLRIRFDGKKCLVIDDSKMCRFIAELLLQQLGISSFLTASVDQGLTIARGEYPDFIMLDLQIPELSGQEILKKLKADELLSRIPVLICSGDTMQETTDAVLQGGAYAFLPKPLQYEKLHAVLSDLFIS